MITSALSQKEVAQRGEKGRPDDRGTRSGEEVRGFVAATEIVLDIFRSWLLIGFVLVVWACHEDPLRLKKQRPSSRLRLNECGGRWVRRLDSRVENVR